jgi:cellulose biosynthesis protein BcsQ
LAQRVAASLNGGRGLSRAWIIPSDYTLAECESKLLVERVIHQRDSLDERYRLAHVLLNPDVRRQYAMIILDTPPRMTLGTVNALVASHCFVIPTILDKVSSEAVRPFLEQIKSLSTELDLNLQLAGVVAMMSRQLGLSEPESGVRDKIKSIVQEELGIDWDPMIAQHVPRKVQISNGEDLGYFLKDSDNRRLSDVFYDAIFDELWRRIHQGPTQIAEAQLADPST